MLDGELTTAQRCQQVDLLFEEQVVLLPPKPLVRLLLDDDDNVPWGDTWRLVALPTERDGLAPAHALVDMDLEHFFLGDDLTPVTGLAPILMVDDLASAVALVARLLDLLNHWAHLAEGDPDTTAIARRARTDCAVLAALAVALDADDIPSKGKLGGLALVKVLEGDVDTVDEIFCLAGA